MSGNPQPGTQSPAKADAPKPDAGKPRKLGRGLSSLMQVEVPVEVTPRHEHITNIVVTPEPAAPAEPIPAAGDGGVDSRAILPPVAAGFPEAAAVAPSAADGLRQIAVLSIGPNRYQPRREFDQEQLRALGESVRRSGLMQPVVVRPARNAAGHIEHDRYELVAGERRWRAAKLAELRAIPALVRDLSDAEAAEWAVVENVQRSDLNPIEKAAAYRALFDGFGLTHGQIAERVGLDRSSVANFIRLTELEPAVQELIARGTLSAGHGKALLALSPGVARVELAKRAAGAGWNVRQLEAQAKPGVAAAPAPGQAASGIASPRQAVLRDVERQLADYLGTKVKLHTNAKGNRGRLVVDFYNLDHFEGLMARIGFKGE